MLQPDITALPVTVAPIVPQPGVTESSAPRPSPLECGAPFHSAAQFGKIPAIVRGIITHYVEPEMRVRLTEPADHLRLIEDLGLDSLTMMEIMIKVEDILQVTVSDEELRHFRTLGDVRQFIDRSVRGTPASSSPALPV